MKQIKHCSKLPGIFITLFLAFAFCNSNAFAQSAGINYTGAKPDASALLDINSQNGPYKGLLIPRVPLISATDATTVTAPLTSLMIYNTQTAGTSPDNVIPGYYYWSGNRWISLVSSGNTGTSGQVLTSNGASAFPTWTTPTGLSGWGLTGNSGTTTGTNFLGTTDNIGLAFKTNNTERARFLPTGELVVGTTALLNSSDVANFYKNQNASTGFFLSNNTSGTAARTVYAATSDNGYTNLVMGTYSGGYTANGMLAANSSVIYSSTTGGFNIGTATGHQLSFWTNNTERARFLNTGEFLVGGTSLVGNEIASFQRNTNALNILYVNNTANGTAAGSFISARTTTGGTATMVGLSGNYTTNGMLVAGGAAFYGASTAGGTIFGEFGNFPVSFWTNNTEKMRITASGNVGVGTPTPAEKLDVAGNVKLSGALMPNNNAGTSGQVLTSNGTSAAPSWTTPGTLGSTSYPLTISSGNIPFATAANVIGSSSALTYDGNGMFANNVNSNNLQVTVRASNTNSGTNQVSVVQAYNGTNQTSLIQLGTGTTGSAGALQIPTVNTAAGLLYSNGSELDIMNANTNGTIRLFSGGTTERARFLSTGEFLVGGTSPVGNEMVSFQRNTNALNILYVNNTVNGTAAGSSISARTPAGGTATMIGLSGNYTTNGMFAAGGTAFCGSSNAGGTAFGELSNFPVSFWTNSTERARFLNTGEFIIGATALLASEQLSIQKNYNGATWARVSNTNTGTSVATEWNATNGTAGGGVGVMGTGVTGGSLFHIPNQAYVYGSGSGGLAVAAYNASGIINFYTGGTAAANERARLLSGGQLLVGYTSLAGNELFGVAGTAQVGNAAGHSLSVGTPAPATTTAMNHIFAGGNAVVGGQNINTGEADFGLNYYFNGGWKYRFSSSGGNYAVPARMVMNGYNTSTRQGSIDFETGPTGGTADNSFSWTTRMSILNNGNVGIGCSDPQYPLHVIGDIASSATVRTTNAVVTGAITSCSDIRYKKDIAPLQNALSNVMKLQGVNYKWRKDEFRDKNFSDALQIGFIAQEIEKIYPQVVLTDVDGYKSVDYSRLTPILVEALKEQQAIINKQQETIDKQQSNVDKLLIENTEVKNRILKIEAMLGTAQQDVQGKK